MYSSEYERNDEKCDKCTLHRFRNTSKHIPGKECDQRYTDEHVVFVELSTSIEKVGQYNQCTQKVELFLGNYQIQKTCGESWYQRNVSTNQISESTFSKEERLSAWNDNQKPSPSFDKQHPIKPQLFISILYLELITSRNPEMMLKSKMQILKANV